MDVCSCRISIGKCAVGRHAEQFRRTRHVVGGVGIVSVAEVGRQKRQQRLHVGFLPMPSSKARDGKTVSQIMRSQGLEAGKIAGCREGNGKPRR